jgi:signal transduction histidine kinase
MHVASRTKTIAFFITLGACLVGLAIALNVAWMILGWREVVPLVLGIIFLGLIIAGVALNTVYLVREIRRNEQQNSFLNAVTHELKTPITSIRLYLQTLERHDLGDAKRREFYRLMLEDADRLAGTVEQVLKAGEVRDSRARKNWREVDFPVLCREAIELARFRHGLVPDQLCFRTEPSDEITIMGNADEIRTAVANLLENAVKYSGPERRILVDVLAPDVDTVQLSVSDNGIGIPRAELKRVFKRFYRVHAHATDKVKGTGLGLFIVRSIARRHGGDAMAESKGEGRGSTFTLSLPRVYRI